MAEYKQDKDRETTVWNTTEKYLIDLNEQKNFEKKIKIWLFKNKSVRDLRDIA